MRNKIFIKSFKVLASVVLIALVSSFIFAGDLSSLIDSIDSQRYKLLQGNNYISNFEKNYTRFNPDYAKSITQEEAFSLMTYRDRKDFVSYEEAVSDVNLYFRLLRYRLGHYDILGGDEVFFEARNSVLAQLEKYKDKIVYTSDLSSIMSSALHFVDDCHLSIDGHQVFYEYNTDTLKYETYLSGLYFEKDNKGYYLLGDNKKVYFDHCDCDNTDIVPMLSEDGSLVYSLILYCSPVNKPKSSIVYFTKGSTNVTWTQTKSDLVMNGFIFKEIDNIAYIGLTGCGAEIEYYIEQLVNKIKTKDIVIIDLRSNGGTHGNVFLEKYLDSKVSLCELACVRVGMTNCVNLQSGQERTDIMGVSGKGIISSCDNLTIVLTDNNTGCAPEEFSQFFKYVTNSIIIGTNTMGHLDGGTVTYGDWGSTGYDPICLRLPNTGMEITVSTDLSLYNDYESMVGKGFLPDIYVSDTSNLIQTVANLLIKEGYITSIVAKEFVSSASYKPKYNDLPFFDENNYTLVEKFESEYGDYYEVKIALNKDNPIGSFYWPDLDTSKKYRVELASTAQIGTWMDIALNQKGSTTCTDLEGKELKICEAFTYGLPYLIGTVNVTTENFREFEAIIRFVPSDKEEDRLDWYIFKSNEIEPLNKLIANNSIYHVYDFSHNWDGKMSDWKNNPYNI